MGSYSSNPIRLAILETDTPVPGIQKEYKSYGGVFEHLFKRACAALDPPQPLNSQLQLSFHNVVDDPESYPKPDTFDAILITGSKASAYEDDDWIIKLVAYTKGLIDGGRARVIGVCFGHQIIGRALGAKVDRNKKGWELSVVDVELNEEGKKVFGREKLTIHQMHRDVVVKRPEGVTNLGTTDFCDTQAFHIPGRMISVQGHPEFTEDMVTEILKMRREQSIITEDVFQDGMKRVANDHDGVAIAQVFLKFLRK